MAVTTKSVEGEHAMSVHFSSDRMDWATPQAFFDEVNAEFNLTLDVCASKENKKCAEWYDGTPTADGLKESWYGKRCWMNPPYGREIGKWMKKAYTESQQRGSLVVCLVPARTDTAWWHDYAVKGEIRFIRGRLKFDGHQNSAPFPSALVIFRRLPAKEQGASSMTDAKKLEFIRFLSETFIQGAQSHNAKLPANEPFAVHSEGYARIILAACDGDFERAMTLAEDMPTRMRMAYAKEPKR